MGVRIYERSPVSALRRRARASYCERPGGGVRARRAVLATSAYPPLLRSVRRRMLPVYDYVLVTEPLSAAQQRGDRLGQPPGD